MSGSYRKTPILGITTAASEKDDKVRANRRLRRAVRSIDLEAAEVLPDRREVSDVWSFAKDGKLWAGHMPWRSSQRGSQVRK
jgi:hypothetical protein